MSKIVIGLVGPIASGKGEVAKYLEQLGFKPHSLSDRVREEAYRRGVNPNRETLQNIGNELRAEHGNAVFAKRTFALLSGNEKLLVIDSIRNPGEIEYLRQNLGARIIGVDAPEHLRLEYYLKRAKHRGEDNATPESFYTANARDLGEGESASGQQVNRCLALADTVINNPFNLELLYEICNRLLREHLCFNPEGLIRSNLERV